MLDMFRKRLRDDEGDVRATTPLVVPQLRQPAIAPRFGALGLPKDDAGGLADRTIDLLDNVGTELAFADRLDQIGRETSTQQHLELELYLRVWRVLHPDAEVEIAVGDAV